jgi:phosphoribosyl-ATP pyrophosphohydrolase/phosphoribosyl-AMP cyclohydrolase
MTAQQALDELDFDEDGLIPAIAQDYETGEVRMLAYMNELAFKKTAETDYAHYWSRSRQELWKKGETSGNVQHVEEIRTDCDQDTVLLLITQEGVACHTGERNCFFNRFVGDGWTEDDPLPEELIGSVLGEIQRIVRDRDQNRPDGSYTVKLLEDSQDKSSEDRLLEKMGEEFTETLLAAKNGSNEQFNGELSDFLYHLLVLLRVKDLELADVAEALGERLPD